MVDAIQSIIDDLERIPRNINSVIDVKKLADEVSKQLQRDANRSFS